MKPNRVAKLTSLAFIIATVFFMLNNADYSSIKIKSRILLNQGEVDDICSRASKKLQDIYDNDSEVVKYKPKEKNYIQTLLDIIQEKSLTSALPYIIRIAPFLAFIALAIFSLIGWLICCCCCCCPSCCCKQKKDENCCRRCSLFVSCVMYIAIIAGTIAGFIFTNQFLQGINGTSCTIMRFYNEVQEGERGVNKKWIGIEGIKSTFKETITSVGDVITKAENAYEGEIIKTNQKPVFESKYDAKLKDNTKTFDHPNPQKAGSKITPIYVQDFGDNLIDGSYLNSVGKEYDIKIQAPVDNIKSTQTITADMKKAEDQIEESFKSVESQIDSISSLLEDNLGSILDDWVLYQGYINQYGNLGFYCLFGVFLGFSVISLIVMILYVCNCSQCIKCILHFIWNLLTLLAIVTFFLGAIIGIASFIGTDGADVISFLLGEENIMSDTPILIPKEKIFETCFVGDGDISDLFSGSNDNPAEFLDELYKISFELKKAINLINENGESEVIKAKNTILDKTQENFKYIKEDELDETLSELSKFTDITNDKTYQENSANPKKDLWVANQKDCKQGYSYSMDGITPTLEKYCLEVGDWTDGNNVKTRYENTPVISGTPGNKNNVYDAASPYIKNLIKIKQESETLIVTLSGKNELLMNEFNKQIGLLKDSLNTVNSAINPLIDIYDDIVGENSSIFSMANCKFVSKNINIVTTELDESLSKVSLIVGAIILSISSCQILSTIFVLIVINRYKVPSRKNKKKLNGNNPENEHLEQAENIPDPKIEKPDL